MSYDDFYGDMPDSCPGCGAYEAFTKEGKVTLILTWVPLLNSMLCDTCRTLYTGWQEKSHYAEESVEKRKPQCVRNVEMIAKGEQPVYVQGC